MTMPSAHTTVSHHALQKYHNRVQELSGTKPERIRTIINHFDRCRPCTDLELLWIRQSKRASKDPDDLGGATHHIDDDSKIVFVLAPDQTIITCYNADYLELVHKNDTTGEKAEIIQTFQKACQEKGPTKLAIAIYMLSEAGFRFNIFGQYKEFEKHIFNTGAIIYYRQQNTNKKFKQVDFTWHGSKSINWRKPMGVLWKLHDFGITDEKSFTAQYGNLPHP